MDVAIAKNCQDVDELETLNKTVTAYLEFAELQARNRRPMHMADWIAKLDDFLRLSERAISRFREERRLARARRPALGAPWAAGSAATPSLFGGGFLRGWRFGQW
jgi:hypothetical protein